MRNKKGFTLIEMLVVIAIIAILVAIIVPTVTRATAKASYATDAANLRSALAEAEIYVLNNESANGDMTGHYTAFTVKGDYTGVTGADTSGIVISYDKSAGTFTAEINGLTATEIGNLAK